MELSPREEILVEAFRKLPPAAAEQISALAQRLAALSSRGSIDWSDSWTDADLREFTAASLDRVDADRQNPH